jgi:hypothetical protein
VKKVKKKQKGKKKVRKKVVKKVGRLKFFLIKNRKRKKKMGEM